MAIEDFANDEWNVPAINGFNDESENLPIDFYRPSKPLVRKTLGVRISIGVRDLYKKVLYWAESKN